MATLARRPKPSGRPARETDLRRANASRDSADRLLVVCGAETTESEYLRGFKHAFQRRALSVKVVEKPGSPTQVVQYAAARWSTAAGEFDQVWCVVDVDDFPDLEHAARLARREDIELVVSNPCFELWLLLHHTDHTRWLTDYRDVRKCLEKHVVVPSNKSVDFERHYGADRWRDATRRARPLSPEGAEHRNNPSTRMWRLALAIHGETGD